MRPVNLLPQSARPYVATGKAGGGSYVLIGVLAALVIAVAAYVVTTNKITSNKDEIAKAQSETAAAQAKVADLQKYGDFTAVAAARVQDVTELAVNRIDYERLLRETSRVLPGGVWLTSLDAESTGAGSTSSTTATTATGPSVHLNGCAPSQNSVATTLVRLRAIHGSADVQLNDSGRALKLGPAAQNSTGGGDCGNNYAFDILVNLSNEVTGFGDMGQRVPADLGGGS
ncbi:MAG TPA: PilN domain-containing protein [Thermoleophilaceae bacterium]